VTSTTAELRTGRGLRWIIAGVGASGMGTGLGVVAFPLLALRLTANPLAISGIAVAAGLPWLVVALPAGALVDRVDRKRLVLFVELARAVVVAFVALGATTSHLPIVAIYVAAFLVGAGETLVSGVSRLSVPLVVEPEDRAKANGALAAAQGVGGELAGPAVGGVLFSVARSVPFLGDAACYVVSGFFQRAGTPANELRSRRPAPGGVAPGGAAPTRRGGAAGSGEGREIWADVTSGMRWLLGNRALRILAVVVGSLAFCQSMVLAVLVLYATHDLHLGATGYGLLVAVPAAADVLTNLQAHRAYTRIGGSTTLVVSGVVAGGAYLLLGATSILAVAGLALVLETVATATGNVANVTMRQELIPLERFGLVNNAMRMCIMGLVPVGALAAGLLARAVGTRPTFLVAGALQLLALAVSAAGVRAALGGRAPGGPAPSS